MSNYIFTDLELMMALAGAAKRLGLGGPKFTPGTVMQTPGVVVEVPAALVYECLARHISGDWGVMPEEDKEQNESMLVLGGRLMSAYPIDPNKPCSGHGENTVWVITDKVGYATTILLPDEY